MIGKSLFLRYNLTANLYHFAIFTWLETKKNLSLFLLPLPIWISLYLYSMCKGLSYINLNRTGIWVYLLMIALLSMVYGLQAFSGETDRKNLDFVLTKPISPYLIVMVKYLISIIWLCYWFLMFHYICKFRLDALPLTKGMGMEWVILIFLIIHGMSFFSGLFVRGLERFFVVILLTGLEAYICYTIWMMALTLVSANYYWFDVPPGQYFLLTRVLPFCLTLLSLLTPLTGAMWCIKNRTKIWQFKPILLSFLLWVLIYGVLVFAQIIFAPPLWPNQDLVSGDWYGEKLIVLLGTTGKALGRNREYFLALTNLGKRETIVYKGAALKNPRFSPDGKRVVFSENGRLNILEVKDRNIIKTGIAGNLAVWSFDGKSILYAQTIGNKKLSELYSLNLTTGKTQKISGDRFQVANMAWDSIGNKLYLFGYLGEVKCLDLKINKIKEFRYENNQKPEFALGTITSSVVLLPKDKVILLGMIYAQKIQIYVVHIVSKEVTLSEEQEDYRIATGAPLLLQNNGKAFIWPRTDGSFVYQGSWYDAIKTGEETPGNEKIEKLNSN